VSGIGPVEYCLVFLASVGLVVIGSVIMDGLGVWIDRRMKK